MKNTKLKKMYKVNIYSERKINRIFLKYGRSTVNVSDCTPKIWNVNRRQFYVM